MKKTVSNDKLIETARDLNSLLTEDPQVPNVQIDVTEEDISEGKVKDCKCCPVALATNRRLRHPFQSVATLGYITISPHANIYTGIKIELPEGVPERMRAFDRQDQVSPFSFTLEIPDAYLRSERNYA